MEITLIPCKGVVKNSKIHGYGVFADRSLSQGEVIEECYALPMQNRIKELHNYYFGAQDQTWLSLGNGGIYNHSSFPNADWSFDNERQVLIYKTIKPIQEGEEIFISYGKQWFVKRGLKEKLTWQKRLKKIFMEMGLIIRFTAVTLLMVGIYSFLKKDIL